MFGYVIANPKELSEEDRRDYQAAYCGVCHALRERNGLTGRFTLTYESAFLALVLMSVYGKDPEAVSGRCPVHPIRPRAYMKGGFVDYAADMNLLLVYYKLLDDRSDDGSLPAGLAAGFFRKRAEQIEEAYPEQSAVIADCLQALLEMEGADEMNPDIPANCFGRLMGTLFTPYRDEKAETLFRFGASLGRFIYTLDAADDLKSDIRKKRYNPLIMTDPRLIGDILSQMMGETVRCAEALGIGRYRQIIENVLYSGVWMKYRRGKDRDSRSL